MEVEVQPGTQEDLEEDIRRRIGSGAEVALEGTAGHTHCSAAGSLLRIQAAVDRQLVVLASNEVGLRFCIPRTDFVVVSTEV